MLKVDLEGAERLAARLDGAPAAVAAVLRAKVAFYALKLKQHIQRDKLEGQVLHHRSGALSRSISADWGEDSGSIYGRVFSSGDVKYAAIHEFGGTTPPHDILPKKADALAFMIGGRKVFAKVVHHPGSKIPERSFLRSGLADMAAEIDTGMKLAVIEELKKQIGQR